MTASECLQLYGFELCSYDVTTELVHSLPNEKPAAQEARRASICLV
jgi:hypothetical protein